MITNELGAYKELCAAARQVIEGSDVATIVGYTPELRYVDRVYDKPAAPDKVWVRISLIQGGEKRRTLGQPSRKTMQGTADMQLFVPATVRNAAEIGRKVADKLKGVYARSTASVDFYAAAIRDMPKEEAWFYKRINATYNYDTFD